MEYDSALTNELRTVVRYSRSVYSQTRLANFDYIPECKSKNPRGLNEISLPLARMTAIAVFLFLISKQNRKQSVQCELIKRPSMCRGQSG